MYSIVIVTTPDLNHTTTYHEHLYTPLEYGSHASILLYVSSLGGLVHQIPVQHAGNSLDADLVMAQIPGISCNNMNRAV